ncbi:BspA-like protein [Candidatus Malacoplasma girerdii]|uniref:BspA-like protein n=1 Tax=Candidatus Malacoplasma girerdii TaxID=1318617 RepID=A0A097SSW3_9BACT|nr:BspA-like protein [Candidatus Malacoplasma girerdii]
MWLYLIHTHTHSSLVVENKATNDISWSIDHNGNIKPVDKRNVTGAIEIPSEVSGKPVTGIGSFAFRNCSSLTSVTFAEDSQLTSIGYWAFIGCNSLKTINIPSSVNEIYIGAFVNTTKLQDITFNWTGKILDDIIQKIKNPVHQRELTTWACIFADYNEKEKNWSF